MYGFLSCFHLFLLIISQVSLKLYEKLIKEFFNTKIREEWKETEGKNILVSSRLLSNFDNNINNE